MRKDSPDIRHKALIARCNIMALAHSRAVAGGWRVIRGRRRMAAQAVAWLKARARDGHRLQKRDVPGILDVLDRHKGEAVWRDADRLVEEARRSWE